MKFSQGDPAIRSERNGFINLFDHYSFFFTFDLFTYTRLCKDKIFNNKKFGKFLLGLTKVLTLKETL